MMPNDRFDRRLPAILEEISQPRTPDYFDDLLGQTARTRQRPAWTLLERWLPMSVVTSRAAVAPRVPLRIVGVVALLLLAVVVGTVLFASSQRHLPAPFGLAAPGRVAYATSGDIYTADPMTGVSIAVVTGHDTDVDPIWSRDGTHFVFEREVNTAGEGRLYVARADGTGLVAITPAITLKPESQPFRYAFSPDGTEVVYTSGPDTASELWVSMADGSGARRIDVGMTVLEASYRPLNGVEIIFTGANSVGIGIYAVDVATTKVRTIVAPAAGVGLGLVKVAPDGSRIVYSASADDAVGRNTYRVQVTAIDGSRTVTLPMPDGATFQDAPTWSNDGTRIAVARGYAAHNEVMTLAVLPASGLGIGTETERGLTGCCDTVLDWAPDDKSILVSPEDLDGVIKQQLLLNPATGLTHLTPWAAIGDPAWQRVAP
jgi:dipeptidyl aminopeptidase/acylaminoacyl peptidase